jgi:hypothetical protein
MSPEERQLLTGLFERVRAAAGNPRDTEAEALIAEATKAQPYAPYLLAQTVIIQDQALNAANERLQALEGKVRQFEARAAEQPRGSGGFLGGLGALFGAGAPPPPRPRGPAPQVGGPWQQQQPQGNWQQPQQGYGQPAPPPQQGPWGGQQAGPGGSFLKGALGTAAGVAGGVLLADSIRGLFTGSGHGGLGIGEGFGGQQGGFGGETVVNNYYGSDADNLGGSDAGQDTSFPDPGTPDPGVQDASDTDSDFGSDFGGDDWSQDV